MNECFGTPPRVALLPPPLRTALHTPRPELGLITPPDPQCVGPQSPSTCRRRAQKYAPPCLPSGPPPYAFTAGTPPALPTQTSRPPSPLLPPALPSSPSSLHLSPSAAAPRCQHTAPLFHTDPPATHQDAQPRPRRDAAPGLPSEPPPVFRSALFLNLHLSAQTALHLTHYARTPSPFFSPSPSTQPLYRPAATAAGSPP